MISVGMSQDNMIDDVISDVSRAFAKMVNASSDFAMALIELRIQRLREAARRDDEAARAAREQMRVHHLADSAVWRAAMRPQWWRDAGAEDISRVWRAASTWQHVDPRAAEARQVVIDRLADRGVHVDPAALSQSSPEDIAWLSDALDRAAADRAARAAAAGTRPGKVRPDRERRSAPGENPTVIDGEVGQEPDPQEPRRTWAEREQKAAEHVRGAWSPERAERVIGCDAWGVLANQLDQVEQAGHDVQALLRGVPDFVDRAHTPAAFAFRSIEDRLDGLVDLGTQSSSDSRATAQPSAVPEAAQGSPTVGGAEASRSSAPAPDTVPAVVPAQVPPDVSVGGAQDSVGDGQAVQVAAQAYPIATKDAVAAVAERAEAVTASAPAGTRSTPSQPRPQQVRKEPRGL
ncbi:hypothetical protein [Actinoplanes subglobosus]|uniref:DUF222 domain-containing protein n=1 Tax=Actinoplanes subglobosus TaxID=1547892 RepID=A0ABV8ITV8_9ACTN